MIWKVLAIGAVLGLLGWWIFSSGSAATHKERCDDLVTEISSALQDFAPVPIDDMVDDNRDKAVEVCQLAPKKFVACAVDEGAYDNCGHIVLVHQGYYMSMLLALMGQVDPKDVKKARGASAPSAS